MMRYPRVLLLLGFGWGFLVPGWAGEFKVVVYNAYHLFDVDGVSLFADFGPEHYGPEQLKSKIRGLTEVMASMGDGAGPEIILFQEFEADQTPTAGGFDADGFLEDTGDRTLEALLTEPLEDWVRNLPVEAFVLKAFQDAGLGPYAVRVGEFREDPTGRTVAHTNAVFTRFPVLGAETHHTDGARGIQEVVVDVKGYPLYLFNNHWKSGAGDSGSEGIRRGNARVLRDRIDTILEGDRLADILVGGDFNSHFDQDLRYPYMESTALNTVLGSQGNERRMMKPGSLDLYNLWYELAPGDRGSDIYRNEWGTLMHIMVTPGLYDCRGVTYVDNSFGVLRLPGRNAVATTGVPVRWHSVGNEGYGYTDHLPLVATFRACRGEEPDWIDLDTPGREADSALVRTAIEPTRVTSIEPGDLIRVPGSLGRTYRFEVVVAGLDPLEVRRGEETVNVWVPNRGLSEKVRTGWKVGEPVAFVATVGTYKGSWQLIIESGEWLIDPD
jgi:hypothetical protein